MYGLNDELINKIKKISKNYTKALNRLKEALLEDYMTKKNQEKYMKM